MILVVMLNFRFENLERKSERKSENQKENQMLAE